MSVKLNVPENSVTYGFAKNPDSLCSSLRGDGWRESPQRRRERERDAREVAVLHLEPSRKSFHKLTGTGGRDQPTDTELENRNATQSQNPALGCPSLYPGSSWGPVCSAEE